MKFGGTVGTRFAGNVNARGRRKTHWAGCGCCGCYDNREELREKIAMREAVEDIASPEDPPQPLPPPPEGDPSHV